MIEVVRIAAVEDNGYMPGYIAYFFPFYKYIRFIPPVHDGYTLPTRQNPDDSATMLTYSFFRGDRSLIRDGDSSRMKAVYFRPSSYF